MRRRKWCCAQSWRRRRKKKKKQKQKQKKKKKKKEKGRRGNVCGDGRACGIVSCTNQILLHLSIEENRMKENRMKENRMKEKRRE